MTHTVKVNGVPVGTLHETKYKKVDDGVEYTLCAFNNNDYSMWVPTYVLRAGNEPQAQF